MCGERRQRKIIVHYWAEIKGKVYGLRERSREYGTVEKNTSLCVCISVRVVPLDLLFHFVIVLYLCECVCRGGKQREDKRGRNIYL